MLKKRKNGNILGVMTSQETLGVSFWKNFENVKLGHNFYFENLPYFSQIHQL